MSSLQLLACLRGINQTFEKSLRLLQDSFYMYHCYSFEWTLAGIPCTLPQLINIPNSLFLVRLLENWMRTPLMPRSPVHTTPSPPPLSLFLSSMAAFLNSRVPPSASRYHQLCSFPVLLIKTRSISSPLSLSLLFYFWIRACGVDAVATLSFEVFAPLLWAAVGTGYWFGSMRKQVFGSASNPSFWLSRANIPCRKSHAVFIFIYFFAWLRPLKVTVTDLSLWSCLSWIESSRCDSRR